MADGWEDLAGMSSAMLLRLAREYGEGEVGGDAGAMLAVVGRDARMLRDCLGAVGRTGDFLSYASARADGLAAEDPDLRPMLAFRGKPLPLSTVAHLHDQFGDDGLAWAREAMADGRVAVRRCGPPREWDPLRFTVMAGMRDGFWEGQEYEAYATFDLGDGGFSMLQCSVCEPDDGDWDHFCVCEHGASLALAFLLNPRSFEGCPDGIEWIGAATG